MVFVLLALLIVIAHVGIASGAQYGDYVAAKMPRYGSEEYNESARELAHINDDYQDHPAQLPASPDYKYEENLKSRPVLVNDDDEWRKTTKRTSRLQKINTKLFSKALNQYRANKIKPKPRVTFSRSLKRRNPDKDAELNRIPVNGGRIKSNDVIDKEEDYFYDESYHDRFHKEKSLRSDGAKVIKRKPRDRSGTSPGVYNEDLDDDDDDEGRADFDDSKEGEYMASEDSLAVDQASGQSLDKEGHIVKRPMPLQVDDDIIARLEAKKISQKTEDEYQDYYDMKRLNYIKKKTTVLYRRTNARATGSTSTRRLQVWTYRRSYVLERHSPSTNDDDEENLLSTTRKKRTRIRNRTKTIGFKPKKIKVFYSYQTLTRTVTTLATSTVKTTAMTKTTALFRKKLPPTLSMAEKSRLSILKKAMLKEGMINRSTTFKPPVLMQVTRQMNTMVMVEPPKPMLNLQLTGNTRSSMLDSPARLLRVKRLMRRKLVAGVRSVQELTHNLDEMVCDYIDVNQLDTANKNNSNVSIIFLLIFTSQFVISTF